jgi:hypothetical protein
MKEVVVKEPASLDELMLAMDVVDTLRHQELVLSREVEADTRDERLLERLREIYTSQGIAVSDEVLAQGVRALRDERFAFPASEPSVTRTLATLYVTRGRWGKWVGGAAAALAVAVIALQLLVWGPGERERAEVPAGLAAAYATVLATTSEQEALEEARAQLAVGEAAVASGDYDEARAATAQLAALNAQLQAQYELRVVSRPDEQSGVWRVPDDNPRARNYYLIVEAIAPNGNALTLPIRSEEDGRTRRVRLFGLRVDEGTFERVAADKRDDGIIQNAAVGAKRRGELEVDYTVPATGAAITEW